MYACMCLPAFECVCVCVSIVCECRLLVNPGSRHPCGPREFFSSHGEFTGLRFMPSIHLSTLSFPLLCVCEYVCICVCVFMCERECMRLHSKRMGTHWAALHAKRRSFFHSLVMYVCVYVYVDMYVYMWSCTLMHERDIYMQMRVRLFKHKLVSRVYMCVDV
jgi:hypothetical protein